MKNVTISLAQYPVALGEPDKNVEAAEAHLAQAVDQGAQIFLLPELWNSGYDLDQAQHYSQMAAEHANWLSGLSAQHNLIIGCTMITRDATGFRNTFHLFIPGQTEAATYHKTHLFRMLREEHYFVPGSAVVTADLGFATAGLATCYDLRFPELFRSLALQGANLFLICAEWGAARTEHWRVFARARAIENQVFLAAVNATGTSGSNEFAGHSVIVSPWGDALAEAGTEPGLVTATIDLDEIERNRKLLPVFQDRRPDLYRV